jgi:hypothetical protein
MTETSRFDSSFRTSAERTVPNIIKTKAIAALTLLTSIMLFLNFFTVHGVNIL